MTTNTNDSAMAALKKIAALGYVDAGLPAKCASQANSAVSIAIEFLAQQSPQALPVEPPIRSVLSEMLEAFRRAHWMHWTPDENAMVTGCVKALAKSAASRSPVATAEATTVAEKIMTHVEGWRSATYGWQGSGDAMEDARRALKAQFAHRAECVRRIAVELAALTPTGQAEAPSGVKS